MTNEKINLELLKPKNQEEEPEEFDLPKDQKITVRLLEAHFSSVQILLDYLNALDNPTARRVKKKYWKSVKELEESSTSLDPCEAVYGYAGYLLRHPKDVKTDNAEAAKRNLAFMAERFNRLNNLGTPSVDYVKRLKMPAEGAHPFVGETETKQ